MKNNISFFLNLDPRKLSTAQQKGFNTKTKNVFLKPKAKETKRLLTEKLSTYRPNKPMDGAIRLVVKYCYPYRKNDKEKPKYKITRPDTDNLNKMLKDVMTDLNYWNDDSQVASEIIEKFYAEPYGIFIEVKNVSLE